ncbi:MAG: SemiSWEET transporter [Thermoplasmatota archaeon]
MVWTSAIGFIAAVLTTSSFVPQVVKVVRTKHTKDISLLMYVIITLGISMWLAYGIFIHDLPVIAANAVTLVFVLLVLFFKIRYR